MRSIYGEHCHPLVIPAHESITIDTPDDWEAAERRLVGAARR
jgi:CMP-N-acetylneuraminic acid synthetase